MITKIIIVKTYAVKIKRTITYINNQIILNIYDEVICRNHYNERSTEQCQITWINTCTRIIDNKPQL